MIRYVFCACLVGVAFSATLHVDRTDEQWKNFKVAYNKTYATITEENIRKEIWHQNLEMIKKHNLEADFGLQTYRLGVNEYSDWSSAEYKKYLNGFRGRAGDFPPNTTYFVRPNNVDLPATVDWRKHGYVTPVKNQGACGSCWAFSTTGAVEGQHFKKTGRLVSLSEQNLVDCAWPEGCEGCGGCWPRYAMNYIKTNRGVDTESCYPYHAKNGNCRFMPNCVGATLSGWVAIRKGNEMDLMSATAAVGPISVAIDANHGSFFQYKSGVYYESQCSQTALDHAVLVVGYGTEGGHDYWLVKNSWGPTWGEQGYIKMARNHGDMCGIASYGTYPTGVGQS